jgi:hypothetical protein
VSEATAPQLACSDIGNPRIATPETMQRAEIRADFIKRLFAVAISIGVATSFVGMHWVRNGTWPNWDEKERMAILAAGLFATVLSWDGYLASIETKRLTNGFRFGIDIVLVFTYMFLLVSASPRLWLPVIAAIFILYVLWDLLTIRDYIDKYDLSIAPEVPTKAGMGQILQVYGRGFLDRPQIERGPVTSLSWAIFFLVFAWLNNASTAPGQVFVAAVVVVLGLFFYRDDKSRVLADGRVRGYRMIVRALLIILMIALVALYFAYFGELRFAPA